jgi:PIN domain nuclease of toxin-antitoxin system
LAVPLQQFVPQQRAAHGIAALALEEVAAALEPALPKLHKDPFDRMLICQAQQAA